MGIAALFGRLLQKPGADVHRHRVEAATVDDSGTALPGICLVFIDHAPNPLDLAGEVTIIGALAHAGGNQLGTVVGVRTHGRQHHPGAGSHRLQRGRIVAVRNQGRQGFGAELRFQGGKLVRIACGDGPPEFAVDAVTLEQVFADQGAREAGGAPHYDVVIALCHSVQFPRLPASDPPKLQVPPTARAG